MFPSLHRAVAFPLCLVLAACANASDDAAPAEMSEGSSSTGSVDASTSGELADGSEGSSTEDSSTADSSTGGAGALIPIDLDRAWIERMEGRWNGPVQTPYLTISQFPLDFAWQPDGRLHANVSDGKETSFDFDFAYDGEHWIFTERGALPGGMVQSHTLHPVEIDGDRVRWIDLEEPEFLVVDLEVDAQQFRMDVSVRGSNHASLAHTPG